MSRDNRSGKLEPIRLLMLGDGSAVYSPLQKLMHWLVLFLCLGQLPTAWAIQRSHIAFQLGLPQNNVDLFLHQVHATSGWLIVLIMITRLGLLVWRGVPPFPSEVPRWQRAAARINHALIYLIIAALAITGTAAMYFTSQAAPIHRTLVNVGVAVIGIHVAAVIWHGSVRRDGVAARMLPARWPRRSLARLARVGGGRRPERA